MTSTPPPESMRQQARFVYGADAQGYERGRPDYPERVYDLLSERCGLAPGVSAIEIGPGTGRVTQRLVAGGARVVAVEPDPVLVAHLAVVTDPATVEVVPATFEDAAVPEGHFDLAVAATSFHWVEQNVGLPKLGRVLRRGGWAAVWWTLHGDPDIAHPFQDAVGVLLGQRPVGARTAPKFELDAAARCRDLAERAGLAGVDAEVMHWSIELDAAQVRAMYASFITLRRQPAPEREVVLDRITALVVENFGGRVQHPLVTAVYTGRRP